MGKFRSYGADWNWHIRVGASLLPPQGNDKIKSSDFLTKYCICLRKAIWHGIAFLSLVSPLFACGVESYLASFLLL